MSVWQGALLLTDRKTCTLAGGAPANGSETNDLAGAGKRAIKSGAAQNRGGLRAIAAGQRRKTCSLFPRGDMV